jgi:hypothetical protein
MYKISDNFNFKIFNNLKVQQVCYSFNAITIFFQKDLFINLTGSFKLVTDENEQIVEICPVESDFGLIKLIEKKILLVKTDSDRSDLIFFFENNVILTIIGDVYYESCSVHIGQKRIII